MITLPTSEIVITALLIALLLSFSAFFSGSETALTAASRASLKSMADKGDKNAQTALSLTEDREGLIGSLLLGNNLVNILATALTTSLFTKLYSDQGVVWATLTMTFLILVFAEVLPKTYAIAYTDKAASFVSPAARIFVLLLKPGVAVVRIIVRLVMRLIGEDVQVSLESRAHEEIKSTIFLHHSEGSVHKHDRDRLLGALDLKNRSVREVMKHRSDIEFISIADGPEAILTHALASPYTRLPILDKTHKDIVGVLHAKDLLRAVNHIVNQDGTGLPGISNLDIASITMPPYYIPETTTLDEQMHNFLLRKSHFAFVVDEYGELLGLITLEDILEEIVGEIEDEHDEWAKEFEKTPDGGYILEGSMTIRDVNRIFDWALEDEPTHTIAGFIIHHAEHIPRVGQIFRIKGLRLEILAREKNRLTKIKVTKEPA